MASPVPSGSNRAGDPGRTTGLTGGRRSDGRVARARARAAPGSLLQHAARGLLYGSACLLLGAAGHAAAGGSLPGIGVWAWLVPLFGLPCALLFGAGQRRFVTTAAFVSAAQGCLHLLLHHLSTAGSPAGHPGLPGPGPTAEGTPGPLTEPAHPAGPVLAGAAPQPPTPR